MPDIGADTMYANATEKGTIDTIPEIPGLAVWHEGHIGIYIGGGKVIEAMGTKYGVVETELAGRGWTHWLKVPYITYLDTEMSSSANEKHIWDTLYAKIGNPYGVAGLMGNLYAESALRPDNLQGSFEDALGHSDASYTQAVDSGRTRDSQRTVPATAWRSGPHRTGKRVFSPMQKSRANRLATWICSLIFCTMSWKRNFRTYSPS